MFTDALKNCYHSVKRFSPRNSPCAPEINITNANPQNIIISAGPDVIASTSATKKGSLRNLSASSLPNRGIRCGQVEGSRSDVAEPEIRQRPSADIISAPSTLPSDRNWKSSLGPPSQLLCLSSVLHVQGSVETFLRGPRLLSRFLRTDRINCMERIHGRPFATVLGYESSSSPFSVMPLSDQSTVG